MQCELCLSLSHPTHECTLVCDSDPDVSTRLKTLESAVLAFTSRAPLQQGLPLRAKSSDVCRNWNAGKCRIPQCRFRHACMALTQPLHAATELSVSVRIPIGNPLVNLHCLNLVVGRAAPSLPSPNLAIVVLGQAPLTVAAVHVRGHCPTGPWGRHPHSDWYC